LLSPSLPRDAVIAGAVLLVTSLTPLLALLLSPLLST
jgi:hypothetical protein